MNVLLVGRKGVVVEDVQKQLDLPNVRLLGGTGIDDVRAALRETQIHHVIIGGGLDLEQRIQIVREVFESSDVTTVHLKDHATGPEGFYSFVSSVLRGLRDYPLGE